MLRPARPGPMIRSRSCRSPVGNVLTSLTFQPPGGVPFVRLQGTYEVDARGKWIGPSAPDDVWGQVIERDEDEGAFPHTGMRDNQVRVMDDALTYQQHVDIQGAGSPALPTDPMGTGLRGLGRCQQLAGRAIRRQLDNQVEKRTLVGWTADRIRLVDG